MMKQTFDQQDGQAQFTNPADDILTTRGPERAEITRILAEGGRLTARQQKLIKTIGKLARKQNQPVPPDITAAQHTLEEQLLAVLRSGTTLGKRDQKTVDEMFRRQRNQIQKTAADQRRAAALANQERAAERKAVRAAARLEMTDVFSNVAATAIVIEPKSELPHAARYMAVRNGATKPYQPVLDGNELLNALREHAECELIGSSSREAARRVAMWVEKDINPLIL